MNCTHRWIAVALGALGVHLPGFRPRLSESLDGLDRVIWKVRPAGSVDRSLAVDSLLDVDALRANKELRQLINLYLRGWTSREIEEHLDKSTSGGCLKS
jgi:hypothetical protein